MYATNTPTEAGGAPYGAGNGLDTGFDLLNGVLRGWAFVEQQKASVDMARGAQQQQQLLNSVQVQEQINANAQQVQGGVSERDILVYGGLAVAAIAAIVVLK